jgi:hypothetical protein
MIDHKTEKPRTYLVRGFILGQQNIFSVSFSHYEAFSPAPSELKAAAFQSGSAYNKPVVFTVARSASCL